MQIATPTLGVGALNAARTSIIWRRGHESAPPGDARPQADCVAIFLTSETAWSTSSGELSSPGVKRAYEAR
jgi:hypothetical protein